MYYKIPVIQCSIVGSGKIKRRILQRHVKAILKDVNKVRRLNERSVKPMEIKITRDERIVLNHWNAKGGRFVVHKTDKQVPTWALIQIIKYIKRRLKKFKTHEICSSIDAVHAMFEDPLFKFRIIKLSLNDFFYLDKRTLATYKEKNKPLYTGGPLSWFDEGRQGFDYLQGKYSRVIKDTYPELTTVLSDMWTNYKGEDFKLKPRHINVLRRLAQKCMAFGNANMKICPPPEVINRIQFMLQKLNYKPPSLHFYLSDYFWEEDFTEELIRWGKHDRRDIVLP